MKFNRILALLLAVCMAVGMVAPCTAVAQSSESAASPSGVSGTQKPTGNALQANSQLLAKFFPQRAEQGLFAHATQISRPSNVSGLLKTNAQEREFTIEADETVRAIVLLEDKGLLEAGYSASEISAMSTSVASVQKQLTAQQNAVMAKVRTVAESLGATAELRYHFTVAANGFAVEVPYGALKQIEALSGVKSVFVAPTYSLPEDMTEQSDTLLQNAAKMPSTKVSTGAAAAWAAGFTGKGMRVVVVDTGLDLDHPSFAASPAEPSLTLEEVRSVLPRLRATERYSGLSAERLYRSEKVPFAFNYVDATLDVTHDHDSQGDHGTHVSGIIAANRTEGTEVVGVAPDAQIIVMKIFGANGGAYFDDILAALEDSYLLNADAVNMSLGTPAGFTSISEEIDEIFSRILESDMLVAVAAGNSGSAASQNGYGTNTNLTIDPDNGIVSSPATYIGSTAVASIEGSDIRFNFVSLADGTKLPYSDAGANALTSLYYWSPEHLAEYIMIPGVGAASDYEGIAPTLTEEGERKYAISIAVVERGSLEFTAKQANAEAAGFDAIIVYDNEDGDALSMTMADNGGIPNVFVTKPSGQKLRAAADETGHGELYLAAADETVALPSPIAGQMSDFSSWGVTSDLQLVPDITAPGGNIYSTLTNGHYGIMSGTSMASPHIAGMSALVLQYLHATYPNLTDAQLHTVAESLLMSTATPAMEFEGIEYSPRKQGSGVANVYAAICSPVYLTVKNGAELTPKVSFGDDDERTGVYRFTFTMNNLTGAAHTYLLDASALTDQFIEVDGLKFMTETSHGLGATAKFAVNGKALDSLYDYNADGKLTMADVQAMLAAINAGSARADFDLNGDGAVDTADAQLLYELASSGFETMPAVTVAAGSSVEVEVTFTLTEADKAYMDENYPCGIYVDGFVRCYAVDEDSCDLSLPFLGFYGDWDEPRVIDDAWYYDGNAIANRYINVLFTDYGTTEFNLGLNPYIYEDYDPAHNVLSPNGDGFQDEICEIYLGMMRSAKDLRFTWLDEDGNVLFEQNYPNAKKNYYMSYYGMVPPLVYTEVCQTYNFRNADGSYAVKDLDRVTLRIEALIDGENVSQTIDTQIVIDTEAPQIVPGTLECFYSEETDARLLRFEVSDNYDIAAVVTMTNGGDAIEYIPVTEKVAGVDGERATILVDVTNYDSSFRIAVCDYGTNETYYDITFSGEKNYDPDAFYGYRLFSVLPVDGNIMLTEGYNGWHSFTDPSKLLMHTYASDSGETAVYAAEYVDGYIIAIDANGEIFAMKSGDWTRMSLGNLEIVEAIDYGDFIYEMTYSYAPLDMALDYTTGKLYVVTDESLQMGPGSGGHLMTVDYLTGEVTDLGVITGFDYGVQALTLAIDNSGVLYTVDSENGDLYTIDKETAVATFVGATGYKPAYQQSMTVDHETDTLYWAGYQGYDGTSALMEIDKTTGKILSSRETEYNSQLAGLYKPYETEQSLIPDEAALTGVQLVNDELTLRVGGTATLRCLPEPYFAKLEGLVWSSSDASIASVDKKGVVTAHREGMVQITATCGAQSVSCSVQVIDPKGTLYVYDYGTDDNASNSWLRFDVSASAGAQSVSGAQSYGSGITAATYVDGFVYAYDGDGAFYRLDAKTLTGKTLRIGDGKLQVNALAYNYADGYFYAINYSGSSYDLCRVNPHTGELETIVSYFDMFYGEPIGGMTIDQDGRFYVLGTNNGVQLTSFRLDEYDFPTDAAWTNLAGVSCTSFGSLIYSLNSDVLYYASADGALYWIRPNVTAEEKEEWGYVYTEFALTAQSVKLDQIGKTVSESTGMAMNMGLFEIPENEPARPDVAITEVTLPESVRLAMNGSKNIGLDVRPWSAEYTVRYTVENPEIAEIDEDGVISGLTVGKTTVTAEVYDAQGALAATLTTQVEVANMEVDLYAFLISDGVVGGMKYVRFPAARPGEITVISEWELQMPYAATYYNGSVYAVIPDDEDYKNHLMILGADSLQIREVLPEEIPYTVGDMTFDYTTGALYAVVSGGTVTGGIAQIDLETGKTTLLQSYNTVLRAVTADADGKLYVITGDGNLCTMDKTTFELEEIAYVGGGSEVFQSLHYDFTTQTAYRITTGSLSAIDLETGTRTSLGLVANAYFQMTALISMPDSDVEPKVPETVEPNGVHLPERAAMVKGETLALDATVLPVSVSKVEAQVRYASSDETIATVDENGVVTAYAAGTVEITAYVGDYSDICTVTVLEEAQKFYVYDETNCRWLQIDTKTGEMTVKRDEAGLSPIMAATDAGDVIYAFDAEGVFYAIDPETFERTKLGDGLLGQTRYVMVDGMALEVDVQITDLSYDAETGRLFGVMNGLYFQNGIYMIYSSIVEVNLQAEGRYSYVTWDFMNVGDVIEIYIENGDSYPCYRPGNLLVQDGYALSVDTWYSSILSRVQLEWNEWNECFNAVGTREQLVHTSMYEWGMYYDSRSFVYDPVYDTYYVIHDLGVDDLGNGKVQGTLYTINIGSGSMQEVCTIGENFICNSLIIR